MIDSPHAEGVGCRSCPATIEVGGFCLDQAIMAQKDAKGGKVPPLLVHMSMHDARFWCATGCNARAAVAADSEVDIAGGGELPSAEAPSTSTLGEHIQVERESAGEKLVPR